jgi:hypothetical protein
LHTPKRDRRYCVLVDDVRAIWSIDPDVFADEPAPGWPCPSAWLTATAEGGAQVLKLETPAVAGWLFGAGDPAGREVGA